MNKLVVIGPLGQMTAFLNVSKDEAIERWLAENADEADEPLFVEELEFDDCFKVYEAWVPRK